MRSAAPGTSSSRRRPAGGRGDEDAGEREGDRRDHRAEPEGRREADPGEQAGDRVAGADPGRARHREQADRGRTRSRGSSSRAVAIASGTRPRPTPCIARPATSSARLEASAATTPPSGDDGEADDQRLAPARAVAEPPHHRRGDDADQERRGQRPLRGAERDAEVVADARDQRRAERGDDPGDHHHEEEDAGHRPDAGASLMRRVPAAASRSGSPRVSAAWASSVSSASGRSASASRMFARISAADLLEALGPGGGDLDHDDAGVLAGARAADQAAALELVDQLGDGRLGERLGLGEFGDPARAVGEGREDARPRSATVGARRSASAGG